jgi:hypothetical protein
LLLPARQNVKVTLITYAASQKRTVDKGPCKKYRDVHARDEKVGHAKGIYARTGEVEGK